jgi:hypothetical protein
MLSLGMTRYGKRKRKLWQSCMALGIIFFQQLLRWKAAVMEASPDSVIEVDCHMDGEKRYFRRLFCATGPYTQVFREVCRPYLSVDSTRLNDRWCGQVATTCGVDGQNWMYPIAFRYFGTETQDNWTWSMENLRKAIRDPPLLAVSSDACKGLANAVNAMFAHIEQKECSIPRRNPKICY